MAEEKNTTQRKSGAFRCHLGWMLSLIFLGLGAKFIMILLYSNPMPYNDQWEGEAVDVYVRYFEHVLSPADFFRAHNEHRILYTRIYDLGLFLLNGQWDSQLQMAGNALIHCLALAGFGWMMATLLGARFWPVIWLPLALALTLPYGWENALWGFQSQFYFLIIFSFLTIWLLGLGEPLSKRWRWGVLVAFGALFTIASGFIASLAVGCLEILKVVKQPRDWRKHLPTFAVCAAVIIAGLLLQGHVPRHEALKPQTPVALIRSFGLNLAWPSVHFPGLGILSLLPLGLLAWLYVRSRETSLRAEEMILGVGIWVIWQGAAVAYARGGAGQFMSWRYMDSACFIMVADCLATALIVARYRVSLAVPILWYVIFAGWVVSCVSGLVSLNRVAHDDYLPLWNKYETNRLATARAFIATDKEDVFKTDDTFDIPYKYPPQLVFLLRLPYIRTNLPACVRPALPVTPAETSNSVFALNGWQLNTADPPTEKSWGSFSAQKAKAHGTFESLPVRKSALPYLEIPVAGDLGQPGLSLTLVDIATGKTTSVTPPQTPDGHWVNVQVRAPAGEFKIVARDNSNTGWFAFKEPRELGRLSYWTIRILGTWKWFLAAGCVCFLWGLITLPQSSRHA